jgi:hypothetical protein
VRGKSRTRVCGFPPLRLHFAKSSVENTLFDGQHKLKLVTHCRDTDAAERNLLDELAAFRAFETLSPASFRTRIARVRYVDTDKDSSPVERERYGFLIETRDDVAERLGAAPIDVMGVKLSQLDDDQAALVFVFQYMIGNTDWSLVRNDDDDECCHNVDLVAIDGVISILPYDFDLAGLVDAPYARPDPALRLRSVKQRRYRGYCLPEPPLRRAVETMIARQHDIIAAALSVPADPRQLDSIETYLDGFFKLTDKPERLLSRFENRCL